MSKPSIFKKIKNHLGLSLVDDDYLIDRFLKFHGSNKSRNEFKELNNILLSNTLTARGYNNASNPVISGEQFFIREILSKTSPNLCFDIGANVGKYSLSLLKETNTKVIAFEPLPFLYESLVNNTFKFHERITIESYGIGSKNENLKMYYNPNASSHASFLEEVNNISYVKNNQEINLPITKLDSYIETHNIKSIDLVKIDVEGFESQVFEGATKTFNKIKPKFIQIEFNHHQLLCNKNLYFFSQQIPEYLVYQLLPNGWVRRDPQDPYANIFAYSNFIFMLP